MTPPSEQSSDGSESLRSLDELLGASKRGRRRGCAVCGAQTAATITIQIREREQGGKMGRGKSWSANMCEAHALERLAKAREALP